MTDLTILDFLIMYMKKIILILITSLSVILLPSFKIPAEKYSANNIQHWSKSADGIWLGQENIQYKLELKDLTVLQSTDGKKWSKSKKGWTDKSGNLLKIADKKVQSSSDSGKTWTEVPDSKWVGNDNKWYKFDQEWTLWINEHMH